jgi:hypothetical protein
VVLGGRVVRLPRAPVTLAGANGRPACPAAGRRIKSQPRLLRLLLPLRRRADAPAGRRRR